MMLHWTWTWKYSFSAICTVKCTLPPTFVRILVKLCWSKKMFVLAIQGTIWIFVLNYSWKHTPQPQITVKRIWKSHLMTLEGMRFWPKESLEHSWSPEAHGEIFNSRVCTGHNICLSVSRVVNEIVPSFISSMNI
jgi:hypothetical protein